MNLLKLDHLASMVAGPVIWSVHFVVCYVLVSLACSLGWSTPGVAGMNFAELGIALVTLAALGLLGYTGAINMRKYRDAGADNDVSRFVALNSLLLCGLSMVAMVWVAFPALVLPTCAR